MRLACAKLASRIRNGDFSSTTYIRLNAEKVKASSQASAVSIGCGLDTRITRAQ